MKIMCEVNIDTSTGEYSIKFRSLDPVKKEIDYTELKKILKKVFENTDEQINDFKPSETTKRILN